MWHALARRTSRLACLPPNPGTLAVTLLHCCRNSRASDLQVQVFNPQTAFAVSAFTAKALVRSYHPLFQWEALTGAFAAVKADMGGVKADMGDAC